MAIFEPSAPGHWTPTAMAAGPFAGLQGGAVAGLLTAEIEAGALARNWGTAVSVSAWFLRPVPMAGLRTAISPVREGGRVAVVDNTLWIEGESDACATVRVTLIRERALDVPGYTAPTPTPVDPVRLLAPARRAAPHGRPWFMDAMEVRSGTDMIWFRVHEPIIADAGALSRALGPADWAHGIFRPVANVVADPNPNLTVHLHRAPRGDWIGVQARTHWQPGQGLGMGAGTLLDVEGAIGAVSMAVALMPFPKLLTA